MRKKKVRTNYDDVRQDELHTLAGKVLDCLRDHDTFTDLPVDISEVETVVQEFQEKWQTAKDGGSRWDKATKDEARENLFKVFSRLATYVNHTAAGNMPLLLSSGFHLESDQKPARVPDVPEMVKLVDGSQVRQLALRFQSVKSAWLYEYQCTHVLDEQGQPVWDADPLYTTSKTRDNIIAPVEPGTVYYARVRARNRIGVSDWSAVTSLLAR